MSKDQEENAKTATSIATAAGGVALAIAGGPVAATTAAALALLPPLVGQVLPGVWDRKIRQAKKWWDDVVREEGADAGVAAAIKSHLSEPNAQEVVSDAFHRVLDSADAVVPALAMLTREYLREQKAPDRFFIDFGRFLTEISTAEYPEVQQLFAAAAAVSTDARSFLELVIKEAVPPVKEHVAALSRPDPNVTAGATGLGTATTFTQRLFQMLKQHGLGRDSLTGIWGSSSGALLLIEKETVKRIARLLV